MSQDQPALDRLAAELDRRISEAKKSATDNPPPSPEEWEARRLRRGRRGRRMIAGLWVWWATAVGAYLAVGLYDHLDASGLRRSLREGPAVWYPALAFAFSCFPVAAVASLVGLWYRAALSRRWIRAAVAPAVLTGILLLSVIAFLAVAYE